MIFCILFALPFRLSRKRCTFADVYDTSLPQTSAEIYRFAQQFHCPFLRPAASLCCSQSSLQALACQAFPCGFVFVGGWLSGLMGRVKERILRYISKRDMYRGGDFAGLKAVTKYRRRICSTIQLFCSTISRQKRHKKGRFLVFLHGNAYLCTALYISRLEMYRFAQQSQHFFFAVRGRAVCRKPSAISLLVVSQDDHLRGQVYPTSGVFPKVTHGV